MLADSVRFDRYELQPRERRLLVGGQPAALGARAFDVLSVLVERAGSLVTKNELLDRVWAGLVVEEANLTVQVSGLRKVLGGELIATIPGRGYRFMGNLGTTPPAAAALPTAAPSAAAPALLGRAADLERLNAALASPGCVTLVGPAGVGKTSLARTFSHAWPSGTVWVDLAPLTEGEQVLQALAGALGAPTPDGSSLHLLVPSIAGRLVVLDNAEHLIDAAAALVSALLASAPALSLLTTCQLPLAVPGERVLRVEPLALDGDDGAALALFIERARAADHRFRADAKTLPLLRAICAQLDGLPLAIEMAAARVPTLGLKGLHDALQGRFAVLTRGARTAAERHRTLHAALDWSYRLLQPEEQRVFRALGVFAGGFTLELAVALAEDRQHDRYAVIDTLAALVDRSLVAADMGSDSDALALPRYRLLETMRAYALELLGQAEELDRARARHAEALHGIAEQATRDSADDALRAAALIEHHNLREAIAWTTQHAPALALPLARKAASLASFSPWRAEALNWLQACQPLLDKPGVSAPERAAWRYEHARQLLFAERWQAAHDESLRARAAYAVLGDDYGRFMASIVLARTGCVSLAELPALCDELRALRDAHPQWPLRATQSLVGTLANAHYLLGDYEQHLALRLEQLELAQAAGQQSLVDAAENNVLAALSLLGRPEETLERCEALLARLAHSDSVNLAYATDIRLGALVDLRRHDKLREIAAASSTLLRRFGLATFPKYAAAALLAEGHHRAVARLVGHSLQLHADLSRQPKQSSRESLAKLEAACRAVLGSVDYELQVAAGRRLDEAGALSQLIDPTQPVSHFLAALGGAQNRGAFQQRAE